MAQKNKGVSRIDPEFEKDMRSLAQIRLNRGLARMNPRELSLAEMTKLFRRTNGYKMSLEEMKTKPKRR